MLLRRILLPAAVVAAALASVAPVVGADLPGGSSSEPQGTVATAGSPGAILSGRIAPGTPLSGRLTVSNTGLVAAFRLDATFQGSRRLARALVVRVVEADGGALVYAGSLAGLVDVDLGTLAAGEQLDLRFSAVLPTESADALQGATLSASFCWSATQL